jgi:hypothetical protein
MPWKCFIARAAGLALCLAVAATPVPSLAQAVPAQTVVVENDRGGLLAERLREIARLRQSGARVEIRGRVCLSSCTMYLAVPDICVDPDVTFGFHGPSSYGRPLSPARFETWSQIMASHYPETLRRWFLSVARYRTSGYYRVSGAQLISMGTPRC